MAPRHCAHEFIHVGFEKFLYGPYDALTGEQAKELAKSAAVVVCLYCGQVRHVHKDGQVDIMRDEGVVNRNPNGKIPS